MQDNHVNTGEPAQTHTNAQIDWAKHPGANDHVRQLVEAALQSGKPIPLEGALPTTDEALANVILATHRTGTEPPAEVQPPEIPAAERCEACLGKGHLTTAGSEKITCPKCQGSGRKPAPSAFGRMSARLKQLAGTKPVRVAGKIVGAVALVAAGALGMAVYKGRQTT